MNACLLSIGLMCFTHGDVEITIPQAILAYYGEARQGDVDISFTLWTDEIGSHEPSRRLCRGAVCVRYDVGRSMVRSDHVWEVALVEEGTSAELQGFRLSASSMALIDAQIDRMSVRPTRGTSMIPLRALLEEAQETGGATSLRPTEREGSD